MNGIISIIIWVLVVVSFVNKLNAKNKKDSADAAASMRNTLSGRNFPGSGTYVGRMSVPTDGNYKGRRTVPTAKKQKISDRDEIGGFSTTEYLEQKARQEEMEDRKERYLEMQRERKESSGRIPPAKRLYEGDSVPSGMTCVRCSYCAADNLIPDGSRQRYSCYFCREEL